MVRRRLPAAENASKLAVEDHLPDLVDEIQESLILVSEEVGGREAAALAFDRATSERHGRQRASIEGYTLDQVIAEYGFLRQVFIDSIRGADLWDFEGVEAVTSVIERASLHAATEFVESINEVQQQQLGMLAHDIRSPLAVAATALAVLRDYGDSPDFEDREELLDITKGSVNRALSLLETMLDSVVLEAGSGLTLDFEEGDFAKEIRSALEEARQTFSPKLFEVDVPGSVVGCFDSTALRRVFENLVSNAIRHGSLNTSIGVKLEDEENFVALSIHNEGQPISPEHHESIFEFAGSEKSLETKGRRSWGIGLSFVKRAAEAHGGSVGVTSDESKGTVFRVIFSKSASKPGKTKTRLGSGTRGGFSSLD